jgi:hypothetical protein
LTQVRPFGSPLFKQFSVCDLIGISHAYGGVLSALSITYSLTPLPPTEGGEARWKERETVVAVYPDRQDILADDAREITGEL